MVQQSQPSIRERVGTGHSAGVQSHHGSVSLGAGMITRAATSSSWVGSVWWSMSWFTHRSGSSMGVVASEMGQTSEAFVEVFVASLDEAVGIEHQCLPGVESHANASLGRASTPSRSPWASR